MESPKDKSKTKFNFPFWLMLFCIFCFTVGQFVPIYFVNADLRQNYYILILILLVLSSGVATFRRIYKPQKKNRSSAIFISVFLGLAVLFMFGILTIAFYFGVWTEANVFYVKKDNPKVKIISRYVNEGAFGGGTEPDDYQVVLHRPILFLFKMETSVDTTKIDRQEWTRLKD
jgi:hypothetical protein